MQLELKDRLILKNQYRILAEVHPHEKEYYLRMVEVLARGYEGEYADLEMYLSTPFSKSESDFVIDVLAMYNQIEWAKSTGVGVPSDRGYLFSYRGFDGNNEIPYLRYADFLINQPGRWDLLKKKERNSHAPMLSTYHNMVASWKQSADQDNLTTDDFIRIAKDA